MKSYGNFLKSRFPKLDVEVIMDFPKDRKGNRIIFRDVILKFGYPIVSKEVSAVIKNARSAYANGKEANNYAVKQLNGEYVSSGTGKKCFNKEKWKFLVDAPFGISNYCCSVFKKNPAKKFSKHSGLKPIIGTMASESSRRRTTWLRYGCNAFNATAPSSKPLSFWLENDVLEFIVRYDLPYPSVYGEIVQDKKGKYRTTGLDRTGCVFCGYGCHLEKEPNRFQRLKVTHPKLWNYCMKPVENGGLGMREVLEYIGVKVE